MNKAMDVVRKLTQPIAQKAALAVARCVIRLVNDAVPLQAVQVDVLAGETRANVERVQEYGFTSVPLPGCRALAVFVGGDRSSGVVVASDDIRFRLKNLNPGEVALYTNEGDKLHFKNGRLIEITAAGGVTVNSPAVTVPEGDVIAGGISLRHHTHDCGHCGSTQGPVGGD
ncbi:MAG: phage baseplate assembly protein V [bacterium]|nr:phage baseplate assembly protein V [bacterium]